MRIPVLVVGILALGRPAYASSMTVTGEVTQVTSRWTADGSRIVTEATVATDTGEQVVVSQLGGTVDGLTMREFPGLTPMVQGMRVTVAAHPDMDLSARMHLAVDGVKVLATPPGYVRTGPTSAGKYLYWESGCVFVTMDEAGTKEVAGDAEFAAIEASIATWNDGTASCSYMQIMSEGKKAVETNGRDKVNIIKFRDLSWCRPATSDDPARCHPDSAAGITTATYVDDAGSSRDGAIVDADVELNGVNFSIAVGGQTLGVQPCKSELANTLTHELGHLLGLEHTCLAFGDPARTDDQGRAVPMCSATSDPTIVNATMYNFQDCGETKKASLEPDDVNAVCGIYPTAKDPGSCEPVGSGGGCCETSRGDSRGGLLLSVLVGLTFVAPFWKRRRSPVTLSR